jgi:hypothetical protein
MLPILSTTIYGRRRRRKEGGFFFSGWVITITNNE